MASQEALRRQSSNYFFVCVAKLPYNDKMVTQSNRSLDLNSIQFYIRTADQSIIGLCRGSVSTGELIPLSYSNAPQAFPITHQCGVHTLCDGTHNNFWWGGSQSIALEAWNSFRRVPNIVLHTRLKLETHKMNRMWSLHCEVLYSVISVLWNICSFILPEYQKENCKMTKAHSNDHSSLYSYHQYTFYTPNQNLQNLTKIYRT